MGIALAGTLAAAMLASGVFDTAAALHRDAPGEPAAVDATAVAPDGTRATLVLFDDFSTPGVVAVIRRLPGASGRTLIAIRRVALTPRLLYTALMLAPAVDRQHAKSLKTTTTVTISRHMRLRPVPREQEARIEALVRSLGSAPGREVHGMGRRPAIDADFGQ